MSKKEVRDILRMEGVLSQGFGMIPRLVMRDRNLTAEAKCIYSYISSFAGGGSQVDLNEDVILDELQMSVEAFLEHLLLLKMYDYIRELRLDGTGESRYVIVMKPQPDAWKQK